MEDNRITRRDFLKGGLAAMGGAVAIQFSKVLSFVQPLVNLQSKRIYIAPDDHTDYFWKAGEEEYRQAFLEMIDYYLNLADNTQSNPSPYQSRWNCDGSYWMWVYEHNKNSTEFQRLIDRIKSGHISVPLNALCICPGGAPAEAVLRGMYYAGQIERKYDLRFRLAYLIENQTMPYGVVSLFAGSGARYSWKGICNCDTRVTNAWDREHEIYWWVGSDGEKLLIKWNSMLLDGCNSCIGGYAEARIPSNVIDFVDTDPDFVSRYPYKVIGAFGAGHDDLKTLTDEFVSVAQDKTDGSRQVIVSNEEDFFVDFETEYGGSLPSVSASFGNEWDLYCASLAEVSARVKRAVEKLRAAEAMATLVSLEDPSFMQTRSDSRDKAWMDLGLFWEHNFGMVGPPSGLVQERIDWQNRLAGEIESYVNNLKSDSVSALGGLIQKVGTNDRFFVFNPLSWIRTDYADIPHTGTQPLHVIDITTGEETPSQILSMGGVQYIRILAKEVPAVGYKVFEVIPGVGQSFLNAAEVKGNVIENQYYKITIADRGAITSWIDKSQNNREYVQPIDGRTINDLGASSGSLQIENVGTVSVTLRATAPAPLNHISWITLIRDSKRIEIRNDINENFDAVYTWGFGFNIDNPDIWHEEVGAVIRAKLKNQGGHYSPRNARYDWLTLNHFADISDGSIGVTLSNADCYFMKLGYSTPDNLDSATPLISPLVGGRVGGDPWGGLPNQGGDTNFIQRFALQTHNTYNPIDAMKFALEHQNPLIAGEVSGGSVYPEKSYTFLTIDNQKVLLWALKPHEEGIDQGIVVRMWNLSQEQESVNLSLTPSPVLGAAKSSHIETIIEAAQISQGNLIAKFNPHQMQTFTMFLNEPPPLPTSPPPTMPPETTPSPSPDYKHRIYLPLTLSSSAPMVKSDDVSTSSKSILDGLNFSKLKIFVHEQISRLCDCLKNLSD